MMTIRAFRARSARLRFRPDLWAHLVGELARRGRGDRETGAFLLSPRSGDGRTVTAVAYLDDLDPASLVGGIHFHMVGYGLLWNICDRDDVRVVGDVHTHPGTSVRQSCIDQANPMLARVGHLAVVMPHFAQGQVRANNVGVHEYLGEVGWRCSYAREAARLIYVGRWA
jgi:proteasome lid subunit RPN8/RPN11